MQLHHIKQILPLKLILKLVSDTLIRIEVIDHLTNLRYTRNILYISQLIINPLGTYLPKQKT